MILGSLVCSDVKTHTCIGYRNLIWLPRLGRSRWVSHLAELCLSLKLEAVQFQYMNTYSNNIQ
jgi:hypothetical protein